MSAGSGNPDITIAWDVAHQTLTASPSPYYAGTPGPGKARIVSWGPDSTIDSIEGITISSKDGGSYDGDQPEVAGGSGRWQWNDPEVATDNYEYVVSAAVPGVGIRTLDPQIINRSG